MPREGAAPNVSALPAPTASMAPPLRLALALAFVVLLGCDAGAPASPDPALGALQVAGAAHLGLDADGRPHMTTRDGAARLELPVADDHADLLFRATTTAGAPLDLEWRGGPRVVRLSSWAAGGHHDLHLDLRRAGTGPATLRVFDGARTVAEAPVPTGVTFPAGTTEREPTSVHVYVDEHGSKIIMYDYDLAPGGSTTLSSSLLGLRNAPVTHVAVALPPAAEDRSNEALAVGGAREITVVRAEVP